VRSSKNQTRSFKQSDNKNCNDASAKYNLSGGERIVKFDDEDIAGLNLDAVLPTEPRGFTPAQMIVCDECLRANAPTRDECLYCTAPLPVTEDSLRLRQPSLRPLEKWEQGFNCILMPKARADFLSDEQLAEVANFLRMETDALKKITGACQPLPLARAATQDGANAIRHRLADVQRSFDVLIVADDELALESKPPVRLRALELTDDGLIGHSVGDYSAEVVLWERIQLLVNGRLYVRRVEVRRGRSFAGCVRRARSGGVDSLAHQQRGLRLFLSGRKENFARRTEFSNADRSFAATGEPCAVR